MNITEDYVSFEVAKLLKEKGFNEKVSTHYLVHPSGFPEFFDKKDEFTEPEDVWLKCPTHQMAMKWLREKRIYFSLVPFIENVGWPKDTWHINFYNSDGIIGGEFPVEGYENAVEAALKYCLENLI